MQLLSVAQYSTVRHLLDSTVLHGHENRGDRLYGITAR